MAIDEKNLRPDSRAQAQAKIEQLKKKRKQAEDQKKLREAMAARNRAQQVRAAGASGATRSMPKADVDMPGSVGSKAPSMMAMYTVKKGDTLSQIAKNYYGSGSQPYWKLIQDANKDLIKDANLIKPGQVFKIPKLPEELKK